MGLSMHSNSHLGVSLMTMAHAAAAWPYLTHACDTHYPWQTANDEVIVGGRIGFTSGRVPIPDKPGLGVELDHDQLARLGERYDKLPYRSGTTWSRCAGTSIPTGAASCPAGRAGACPTPTPAEGSVGRRSIPLRGQLAEATRIQRPVGA